MKEMKDSGFSWIGEIPKSWTVVPVKVAFSEIKTKNSDGAITNALKFKFGEIVSKSNFDSETDDYVADTILNYTVVDPRTIMINGLNLNYDFKTLRTGLVKEKGVITSAYLALKPDENIIWAEYATYLFKGYETKMAFHNMGSGIRLTLGFKEFKNQPLLLPTLPEQKAIAAFLDTKCAEIDAAIAKTKATIEEYKKLKQSVITEAVTKDIRGDRPMKDSGIEWIGEVPENWAVIKATRIISSTQNGLTRRDLEKSDGQIVLKLKNITADGQISYEEINRIPLSEKEIETYALNDGDFLFVRVNGSKNLVGKSAIYKALSETVAYNDHIIRVRLNSLCDKHYFHWYLLSNAGKTEIDLHTSTAAGQFTISGDGLRDLYIVLPSANEQKEIADYLDQKCAEIDTLIAKKTTLLEEMETYKKSVIYEYVTGKKEIV